MFELIPVPSEPIRQNWLRYYRMLEHKLNKLKSDWRLFEQQSHPLYQKWYHSTFASELARLREWNERAQKQDRILNAIVAHQRIYALGEIEAYVRVRDKLKRGQDPFPPVEDIERFQRQQREREERARERRAREQERRRERQGDERTQDPEDELWEYIQRKIREQEEAEAHAGHDESESGSGRRPVHVQSMAEDATQARREDEIKTLYRKIVRALHPDSGREMSDVEKEWWNQAQVAYKYEDLETLKLIALKVQSEGEVVIDAIDHIGTLVDLCAALIDERDQLQLQRRRMKRDPIFRFWSSRARPKNRAKLQFDLRIELEQQYRQLKSFVDQAEGALQELEWVLTTGPEEAEEEDAWEPRRSGRGRGRGARRSGRR